MKKYRKKVIETEQWFKVTYDREAGHGTAPEDMPIYHLNVGYYRTPDLDGQIKCKSCGNIMHDHGWLDTPEGGQVVCPGDWIIIVIEAEQWFKFDDVPEAHIHPMAGDTDHGWVHTLEGGHEITPGDWIIKGVKGEFSVCKSDMFELTYEEEKKMSEEITEARRTIKNALDNDEGLRIAYISNVAMLLYDELGGTMVNKDERDSLAMKILHLIFS